MGLPGFDDWLTDQDRWAGHPSMPKPSYRYVGCVRNDISGHKLKPYYIFESDVYGVIHINAEDFWWIPNG